VGMPNWEGRQTETEIREDFEHLEMAKNKFSWYEFFAGGGMARLGLGPRWNCIFANEWCEKKARAYRSNFGESPELIVRDVGNILTGELPGDPSLVWVNLAGEARHSIPTAQ
jgi:hypothetical protein